MPYVLDEVVGRCDFLDLLEEAAIRKKPVKIGLRSGEAFEDVVTDVVTENHKDYAVLQSRGRIAVEELASCSRSDTTADIPLDNAHH